MTTQSSQQNTLISSLSIFFPCFNEEKNIPVFVEEALQVLPQLAKKYEILIINDGSSDGTKDVVRELSRKHPQVRLISHPKNLGYGASIQSGFRNARHRWVFFTDGDCQFSLKQLSLLTAHTENYQAIIGFRKKRAEGFARQRNAALYKLFIDALFRVHVKDIDCAYKLFEKKIIDQLYLESTGAFISAELLYRLKKKGIKFHQVGVDHFPRKFGNPTGSKLSVIIKACVDALKLYVHIKFPKMFLRQKKKKHRR